MDQSMMSIVWIAGIGALMYFMMIRPQQKQRKARDEMMGNLKKGDRVVTVGGIYGIVRSIKEDKVTLEIASEVFVQFSKGSIGSVLSAAKVAKETGTEPETIMDQEESLDEVEDIEYEIEQDQDEE